MIREAEGHDDNDVTHKIESVLMANIEPKS